MPPSDRTSGRAGPLPPVPAFESVPADGEADQLEPMVMYEAMRYARLAIADAPTAARTWGAYQHYGDPFFRLLDAEALTETGTSADGGTTSRSVKKDATEGSAIVTVKSARKRNRDCGTAIGAQGCHQPQRAVTNGIPERERQ